MELKVVWTRRAKDNYTKILDYITEKFGNPAGKKYNDRLFELIDIIRTYPEIGRKQLEKNDLRAVILFKRTTVFYIKKGNLIRIINVVDNRWEV